MKNTSLCYLFQFHKGTIRTTDELKQVYNIVKFQFHKGTIRTYCCARRRSGIPYFNSIKVQLERNSQISRPSLTRFQFHKGTIRTEESSSPNLVISDISIP